MCYQTRLYLGREITCKIKQKVREITKSEKKHKKTMNQRKKKK